MVSSFNMRRSDGDAPFNMAQLFYMRLNELMAHKSRAKLASDVNDWYISLVEIHTQISFKLKKEENEKIIKSLCKIRGYIYSPMPKNKHAAHKMRNLINSRVVLWLDEIDMLLMHMMDKHKMIFPRIDTRAPMEVLRQDMGLDK